MCWQLLLSVRLNNYLVSCGQDWSYQVTCPLGSYCKNLGRGPLVGGICTPYLNLLPGIPKNSPVFPSPIPRFTAPSPIPAQTGSPTPTPETGKIVKRSEVISLRDLRFTIPAGWWIAPASNPYFGDNFIYINPTPPKYPGESIFTFKAVSNKYQPTLDYQHYLSVTRRETVYVSGIKGELLIGYATPPTGPDITCPECYLGKYKNNEKVAITLINKGNNFYTLEGSVENYEKSYRQILSTLNFP